MMESTPSRTPDEHKPKDVRKPTERGTEPMRTTPSQAEGEREPENDVRDMPYSTPSQAEGEA